MGKGVSMKKRRTTKLSCHIFYEGAGRKHGGAGRNRLQAETILPLCPL